ncbi:MAG: GWxTD domain-containing protein [Bacteroidia bacterium]|nr:GWxTD domain-containing protein [Bacteroidia bacterium]
MKTFISVILLCICMHLADAKNVKALFSFSRFNSTTNGAYIETYLTVDGNSVVFKPEANGYMAVININIVIKDSTGQQVFTDTYNLNSPVVNDTTQINFNFIDQQRIKLNPGKYQMVFTLADKNGNGQSFASTSSINLSWLSDRISTSDITLLESYKPATTETAITKNGYDMMPYTDNFYPKSMNSLIFYAEIYNADKVLGSNNGYVLSYYLINDESKIILDEYKVTKREIAKPTTILMSEINIEKLASGNYNLIIELRNKNNELIGFTERYIQRSNFIAPANSDIAISNIDVAQTFVNAITDADTLKEFVACLRPICNPTQTVWQDNQLKLADLRMMQQFFYDFWFKKNPTAPEKAWLDYKAQVALVHQIYGDRFTKGYTTERGRVYLQYGAPNSVTKRDHEPDAYPYEIWQYYKIKNQTNRKFVFYNPNLAGNDYRLLHSDMNGEVMNNNWSMDLHKRNSQSLDYDVEKRRQYIGNQSQESFDVPR